VQLFLRVIDDGLEALDQVLQILDLDILLENGVFQVNGQRLEPAAHTWINIRRHCITSLHYVARRRQFQTLFLNFFYFLYEVKKACIA
jgi:hypothetical protein